MTAWEMVEYFGRLYRIEEETLKERMEVIFERFQMNHFRDMLGSKMSTGMKQKVSRLFMTPANVQLHALSLSRTHESPEIALRP